jgi:uncharacterized protein (UPF0210 family)
MWYRKAMDLNDLNREFPEEREQVIDFMEEEKGKEDVENLFQKVRSGEEYTSPSGAIRVNPRIEIPPMRNQDIDGTFNLITYDFQEMHQNVSDMPHKIQMFIDLSKTLERYIPADSNFIPEMESIKSYFESLSNYLWDVIKKEEAKLPKMKQYVATQTPEEQDEIRKHNSAVIKFFDAYESPYLDEEISHVVNDKFARVTKLINEVAPKIMNRDGKTEWLNTMAKHEIGANFLPNNLRSQYLKIMKARYGGY